MAKKAKLSDYRPQRQNANAHTPRGMGMLAKSIGQDGWIGGMTVAADGETFDGSARLETLADAMPGIEPIVVDTDGSRPVIVRRTDIPSADDPRAKRLGIAANRIQQVDYAPDPVVLADMAGEIDLSQFWNTDELAEILREAAGNDAEDPGADVDRAGELQEKWGTAIGDLWVVGKHRLICGDSTDAATVARLFGADKPVLMVTDPPYGVEYDPDWRNRADRANGKPYGAIAVGQVTNDDRSDWREAWALFPGDVVYCWHAGRHASNVQVSLEAAGFVIRSQIIWAKPRFVISRGDYHWQHEPCWYAVRKGGTGHWNGDRSQTTLWEIEHQKSETGHGTQKPIECMARPIQNNSKPGECVYDPFVGSGTTLVGCEQLGRVGLACEIDPGYVAICLERLTGLGLDAHKVD